MKRLNIKLIGLTLMAAAGFASCSDEFLQEKINYDQADPSIYNNFVGAQARLNDCYRYSLPDINSDPNWQHPSMGKADELAKCTEEFSGWGVFVDPINTLNTTTGIAQQPDYFLGADPANIQSNVWGIIRNINDALIGIEGSTLSQEEKNELLGQLYVLRAWRYFLMWKWYGGIPIITDLPEIAAGSVTPRSSAKAVYEFIIEDLRTAAELLEPFTGAGQWRANDNYGRVSMATALALKGRVMVWWCSPLFNRAGDPQRYIDVYDEMKADLEKINGAGYALYKPEGNGNTIKDWANMFSLMGAEDTEGLFITRYNNIAEGGVPDYSRNNPWERAIRPVNTLGNGGITPSKMIMDIFPMRDGGVNDYTKLTHYTKLQTSTLEYDATLPFLNRDGRFYRTFGFPGIEWTHDGSAMSEGTNMNPFAGSAYELWNYVWYAEADKVGDATSSATYGADNLLGSVRGLYLTKRSTGDKYLYDYKDPSSGGQGFRYSYQSYMELRYAEALLNLAEVACGAGDTDYAVELVKMVRQRAGYIADNDFGITPASYTDQGTCFAQVLYERQIELAFEGKRFDDMRRWLLFDGGVNFSQIPGAPQTWMIGGMWGSSTCDLIGYKPFNGQRRENIEWQVKPALNEGVGGNKWDVGKWDEMPDPIAKYVFEHGTYDAATGEWVAWSKNQTWSDFKSWRTGFRVQLNKLNLKNGALDTKLVALADSFYTPYLQAKMKRGDGLNSDKTSDGMVVSYLPRYYLLGLNRTGQQKNETLEQTIGWEDYVGGGQGTFDPLAE